MRKIWWALLVFGCKGNDPAPGDVALEATSPQGVILITADDLGWRDLSSYGLPNVDTPNIDRLASEGVAFDRAFNVVSSCSPSRASIATGQYPHTTGVTGLVHRLPELSLPGGYDNGVQILDDAGYATAIQGKWHLSSVEEPGAFGYDEYLYTDIDQVIRSSDDAISFLEEHGDGPFYLELNYMQTHRNLFGEFQQADGYEVPDEGGVPPEFWGLEDWPEIRDEVAGYLSQLRWMDALIGEVLDDLDERGLADDTLVVFISDNGPPFPGNKLSLYDRGTGTPLMFRWPRGLEPARRDMLVSSVDVMPTILELVEAPALASPQGRSLLPLLVGDDDAGRTATFSEMESHAGDPKPARAVRTDEYAYIRNLTDLPLGSGDGDGAWVDQLALEPDQTWDEERVAEELYFIPDDPLQRNNLVDEPAHGDVLAEMREFLEAHMLQTDDFRLSELR